MSTDHIPDTKKMVPPLGLGSSEGLGPLPEPDLQTDPCSADGTQTDYYTAGTVRRLLAAERERLKADAESWGNALNEAGWAATEAYRRHTGQVEPAIFFNHAKGILRDALAVYFKALRA